MAKLVEQHGDAKLTHLLLNRRDGSEPCCASDPGSEAEISPNAPNFPSEGPRPVRGGDGAGG